MHHWSIFYKTLTSLRLFPAHLRSIRIIWAPLTSCITFENVISFEPIFWIWTTLGWRLRRHVGLSLIYLYSSTKKERGEGGLCLLSEGTKIFPEWKLRNYKSNVNETYMTQRSKFASAIGKCRDFCRGISLFSSICLSKKKLSRQLNSQESIKKYYFKNKKIYIFV